MDWFFFCSDLGTLAKPSYRTMLERIRDHAPLYNSCSLTYVPKRLCLSLWFPNLCQGQGKFANPNLKLFS